MWFVGLAVVRRRLNDEPERGVVFVVSIAVSARSMVRRLASMAPAAFKGIFCLGGAPVLAPPLLFSSHLEGSS